MALNVLITGASGVLGSALVTEMRAAGYNVLPTGRTRTATTDTRWDVAKEDAPNASFRADVVIHNAAAMGRLGHALEFAEHLFQVNVEGTRRVAAWCARENVPQVIYVSGALVYGEWSTPRKESELPEPWHAGAYAVSKYCGEQVVRQLVTEKVAVAVLRLSSLIGAGYKNHLLERLTAEGLEGRIELAPPFDDGFDLLHVTDAARTVRRVIEQRAAGIWNLGSGNVTTLQEVGAAVAQATQAELVFKQEPQTRVRRTLNWVDDTRAREMLGHINRMNLDDMVAETVKLLRTRG